MQLKVYNSDTVAFVTTFGPLPRRVNVDRTTMQEVYKAIDSLTNSLSRAADGESGSLARKSAAVGGVFALQSLKISLEKAEGEFIEAMEKHYDAEKARICSICGNQLGDQFYGAGDGTGQKFCCEDCYKSLGAKE